MSLAFITGRAPIAINSLQPADNSLSIGPGTAKTFRFSCREIDAVIILPLLKHPVISTITGCLFMHVSHLCLNALTSSIF